MEALFHNCLEVQQRGGWYFPTRFTKSQYHYFLLEERFRTRMVSTAGACLRFVTDAAGISFQYRVGSMLERRTGIDLFENGEPRSFWDIGDENLSGTFTYRRETAGQAEFEVWLPALCTLEISGFEVGEWRAVPQAQRSLLALGDSITQGVYAARPSRVYPVQLARRMGLGLINQAISGYVFDAEWLEKLEINPALILVAYGTNDIKRMGEEQPICHNADRFFDRLRTLWPETDLYYLSPLWRADFTPERQRQFEQICRSLEAVAGQYRATVVSGLSLLPHSTDWMRDGYLHPNDYGYDLMAKGLGEIFCP